MSKRYIISSSTAVTEIDNIKEQFNFKNAKYRIADAFSILDYLEIDENDANTIRLCLSGYNNLLNAVQCAEQVDDGEQD